MMSDKISDKMACLLADYEDPRMIMSDEDITKKQALKDIDIISKDILKTLNIKPRKTLRKNMNTVYKEYIKIMEECTQ